MRKEKKDDMNDWPRPSPTPKSSIVLLIINLVAVYFIHDYNISFYWLLPSIALNIFFFGVEKNIYFREKRNFDGWSREMASIMRKPSPQDIWIKNINSVRRKRKISYKQRKKHEWIETISTSP